MKDLSDLVKKWDLERIKNPAIIQDIQNFYANIYETIQILSQFKFEPYQPLPYPIEKDFLERLSEWLGEFDEDKKKFLFYLASKIIFYTREQIDDLILFIYDRKIKKILLDEIIEKSDDIEEFSYFEALEDLEEELNRTLFVALSDSAKLNDFMHFNNEIKRAKSMGVELSTLLYPSIQKGKLTDPNKIKICENFEKEVLLCDELLIDKKRIVILENDCCSGTDFIEALNLIHNSNLKFESIILAPYILSYLGKKRILDWIKNHFIKNRSIHLVYGSLVPEEAKCFDHDNSYLKSDWLDDSIDICYEIKQICIQIYDENYPPKPEYKFGYNQLKTLMVTYYNCPDTTLPIIWFPNENKWKPLFLRASRHI